MSSGHYNVVSLFVFLRFTLMPIFEYLYMLSIITEFCKLYLSPAGCNSDSNLLSIFRFSCIRYCINSPFGAIVLLLNHYFSIFIYLNTFLQIEGSERDKRILKVVFLWFTSNITNCTNPKKKCQTNFL